jgi:hypothetical protein
VLLPLFLVASAVFSAGIAAYGSNALWAKYPHGIELIMLSRRLEWPLWALSILFAIGLLALIASGKRRAWWLIGLGPVLALFAHRFLADASNRLVVVEDPPFVTADEAKFLADDDYVVGLRFGDSTFAYPYFQLYQAPVVIQADHEKRMILMWSPFANRAVAQVITHEVKARDLEIVSMPANALLVYNRSMGQFINGIQGRLMDGQKPTGFGSPIAVSTMIWKDWVGINPDTKVMRLELNKPLANAPRSPILPTNPMPPAILDDPPLTRIVLVGTTQPAAIRSDQVGPEPSVVTVDGEPAFVFRESADKPVRAFSSHFRARESKQEYIPRFTLDRAHRFKGAMFLDDDTGSGWSSAGIWLDGLRELRPDLKGTRLRPVPVQDGLYWGVMKFWYPTLKLSSPRKEGESGATSGS